MIMIADQTLTADVDRNVSSCHWPMLCRLWKNYPSRVSLALQCMRPSLWDVFPISLMSCVTTMSRRIPTSVTTSAFPLFFTFLHCASCASVTHTSAILFGLARPGGNDLGRAGSWQTPVPLTPSSSDVLRSSPSRPIRRSRSAFCRAFRPASNHSLSARRSDHLHNRALHHRPSCSSPNYELCIYRLSYPFHP